MRCRCSISRSRRRGASPSSARTSSRACGSAVLPFGLGRTLRFMQTLLSARPRRAILDCGQVDSWEAARLTSTRPQPMSPPIVANRLLAVVAEVAREARPHFDAYVALDSSLERELGLDSLARVELVLRLEREFAASLPEQALASSETPRDLLRFLLASAGQAPKAADRTLASLVQAEGVRPPDAARTLTEALEYHAQRQPERLTVHLYEEGDEKSLTYRALWDGALL